MLKICILHADPLEFGRDLNAARYVGGKRETPNAQVSVISPFQLLSSLC